MIQRQFTITVNGEKITISRVTKKAAEKRFNAGETIYIYPVYANPASHWFSGDYGFKKETGYKTFSELVNAFSWYNCNYAELGKYPAYYIRKEN